MINEDDLSLKLLAGIPIIIEDLGEIYFPKLREIIIFGEQKYNQLLSCLLVTKDLFEQLKNEDLTSLEIAMIYCYQDKQFKEIFLKAFSMFFQKELLVDTKGFFYFKEGENKIHILPEQFNDIQFILKKANNIQIKTEPEYNPGNERAAKFIQKMLKTKKNKPVPKNKTDLHSIISGLAWKANNVNIFNIFDLTIYQLYDAFYRLENIDNYHYTLSGIYAGTVDGKKIDIKNINWFNKIKFNY